MTTSKSKFIFKWFGLITLCSLMFLSGYYVCDIKDDPNYIPVEKYDSLKSNFDKNCFERAECKFKNDSIIHEDSEQVETLYGEIGFLQNRCESLGISLNNCQDCCHNYKVITIFH